MTRTPVALVALSLLALAAAPPTSSRAEEGPAHPTLAIGAKAPDFDLPGVDGKRYTLASFAGAKVLVFVFTANHCPTAQAYEERIEKLHADFAGRGVQFVLVSPNDPLALRLDEQGYSDLGDSLEDMKVRAKDRGWTFPYLYDGETEAMSRQYGPVATPHVFVFDAERKLRFVGRVDDGENPAKVTTQRHSQRDRGGARREARARRDDQGLRLLGEVVGQAALGEGRATRSGRRSRSPWRRSTRPGSGPRSRNEGGKKLRLVNVWATWCGPCVIEFPDLVSLHRIYRGREFEVVTVNADDAAQAREGPRVPEDAAGLDPQLRLRQGRPLRARRGGGPEVAGRAAAHDRGGARRAR